MKSEFTLAFNEITERFGLPKETVMEALEAAMVSAYRRSVNASSAQGVQAKLNPDTGEVRVFVEKEVVDKVQTAQTEVELDEARKVDPEAQLGGVMLVESTPRDFGRVAAQTAKQVILQRLREAERDAQYEEFIEREGDMVHGTVHSITPQAVTVGLGRAEAILPKNQQIPGEQFRVRDRVRVYVLEVRKSPRGPVIVVTRTHPNMLRRLLEMEVPEISQGLVEIKGIAREAGKRAKVAVSALRDGIDPVGACVGLRGVRIQSIVRDLNDEKIDVIEWSGDPALFIAKSLSPARVSGVFLDDDPQKGKTALVVVPEDQLSLAIGRAGVNARLAARLTGWRIDIKSLVEAASEALRTLETEVSFAPFAEREASLVPQIQAILLKKEENRPLTPEEYQVLTSFVGRYQREVEQGRSALRMAWLQRQAEVRAAIPKGAYVTALEEVGLPEPLLGVLKTAGFETAAQVLEQIGMDADRILALPDVGPRALEDIQQALSTFEFPEPVKLEEVAAPAEAELAGEPIEAAAREPEAAIEAPVVEPVETEEAAGVEPPAEEVVAEAIPVAVPEEAVAEAGLPEDLEKVFESVAEGLVLVGIEPGEETEEEDDEDQGPKKKKRKKGKKPVRTVEYDPDSGEMLVKRRRKRGAGDEWDA
jgi:N utilization substance protein A